MKELRRRYTALGRANRFSVGVCGIRLCDGGSGELGEAEAVSHLIKLINDPDADVRMAAIQALGKIGSTQAKECLEQCLDSANEVVCQTAEQVLNELEAQEDPLSYRL